MRTLIVNAVAATLFAATAGCSSMGMGHGMGGHAMSGSGTGMGMGGAGMAESTPGWSMMSEKERDEHRSRMRSGMSTADCQRYMEEHRRKMMERAKERGATLPGEMGQGMCAGAQQ